MQNQAVQIAVTLTLSIVMSEAWILQSLRQSFQELVIAVLVYVRIVQSCIWNERDPDSKLPGTKVALFSK